MIDEMSSNLVNPIDTVNDTQTIENEMVFHAASHILSGMMASEILPVPADRTNNFYEEVDKGLIKLSKNMARELYKEVFNDKVM